MRVGRDGKVKGSSYKKLGLDATLYLGLGEAGIRFFEVGRGNGGPGVNYASTDHAVLFALD